MTDDWKFWKFAGIYGIRHISDGKIYVGQSQNIAQRIRFHKNSDKDCTHLCRAVNCYGWETFDVIVLERVDDLTLLNEREQYWMDSLESHNTEKGYNIRRTVDAKIGGIDRNQKSSTSFAISCEAKRILRMLSEHFDISQSGVIEMLVLERAKVAHVDACTDCV